MQNVASAFSRTGNLAGNILVAMLPIEPRFQHRVPGDWRLLEIALYLPGPEEVLHPLRRNLMISIVAAIALLAAIMVFLVRLKAYVRAKTIEAQVKRPGLFNFVCCLGLLTTPRLSLPGNACLRARSFATCFQLGEGRVPIFAALLNWR